MFRSRIGNKIVVCGFSENEEFLSPDREGEFPKVFEVFYHPTNLVGNFSKAIYKPLSLVPCKNPLDEALPCGKEECLLSRELEVIKACKQKKQQQKWFPKILALARYSSCSYGVFTQPFGTSFSSFFTDSLSRLEYPFFSGFKIAALATQLYNAENFLFQAKIVHCGLNPEHILFDAQSHKLKICSFTENKPISSEGNLLLSTKEKFLRSENQPPEFFCHQNHPDSVQKIVAEKYLVFLVCKAFLECFLLNGKGYRNIPNNKILSLKKFEQRQCCLKLGFKKSPKLPILLRENFEW
jgi:serine/threonine protein kinase